MHSVRPGALSLHRPSRGLGEEALGGLGGRLEAPNLFLCSGRRGSGGSLRWSESVCSWAPGGTPPNVSAFDPG